MSVTGVLFPIVLWRRTSLLLLRQLPVLSGRRQGSCEVQVRGVSRLGHGNVPIDIPVFMTIVCFANPLVLPLNWFTSSSICILFLYTIT